LQSGHFWVLQKVFSRFIMAAPHTASQFTPAGINFPLYIWHHDGGAMEIINFPQQKFSEMAASGTCPHCSVNSHFRQVAIHREVPLMIPEQNIWRQRAASICECVSCKQFILVIGTRSSKPGRQLDPNGQVEAAFVLNDVFPIGKPNDKVDESVPAGVAADFKEAQRCYFIEAYKATVTMCRRAIQSSVNNQEADGKSLIHQIDDLFKSGKITEALKNFAHHVRMTGNEGAHPDKDGLWDTVKDDASDMIEFTQQYLDHIYVMPSKLKARKEKNKPERMEPKK
jgi:hypothetical protein